MTEKWPFFHFSCECPDGKFGVTCEEESSACTTGRHNCAEGSECTVMKDGSYECLCPLGTYFLMNLSCKKFTYTLFMLQSCKNIAFIFAISYMSWINYSVFLIRYCFWKHYLIISCRGLKHSLHEFSLLQKDPTNQFLWLMKSQ